MVSPPNYKPVPMPLLIICPGKTWVKEGEREAAAATAAVAAAAVVTAVVEREGGGENRRKKQVTYNCCTCVVLYMCCTCGVVCKTQLLYTH